ncbi:MAG TPA: hypothetical protein VFY55_08635 [Nitrososphaeraceae archaeon]|jgi:hypothetical protein|nr:hypothetical protein [Nitrososphaeraceae archaeon]
MNEAHTAEHNATHEDSEESETIKIVNLNEIFASQMNKKGLIAEAVPIGTLNLEREEYYNNDIASNPRFITNRGCIMIKDKEISMIQIIQRY